MPWVGLRYTRVHRTNPVLLIGALAVRLGRKECRQGSPPIYSTGGPAGRQSAPPSAVVPIEEARATGHEED